MVVTREAAAWEAAEMEAEGVVGERAAAAMAAVARVVLKAVLRVVEVRGEVGKAVAAGG